MAASLADGYDQNIGHCIILNTDWTSETGTPNDQCTTADPDDTTT